MSLMNPVGAHIESCEICQTARAHQQPIVERVMRENAGEIARPHIPCADCGVDQVGVMIYLQDDLWQKVARGADPLILCVNCIEGRLGRRLEVADLQDIPVNAPWRYAIERYVK